MDSLMEALQTGSAFSRPDQRRKRQTRAAGGKFKIRVNNKGHMTLKLTKGVWKLKRTPSNKQANDEVHIKKIKKMNASDLSIKEEFNSIISGIRVLNDDTEDPRVKIDLVKRKLDFSQKKYNNYNNNKKLFNKSKSRMFRKMQNTSKSFDKNVSLSRPKIVVGKRPRRNAFVRQVVVKRRKKIAKKVKSHRPGKYLGSPPSVNTTLPILCELKRASTVRRTAKSRLSLSCNDLPSKVNDGTVAKLITKFANEQQEFKIPVIKKKKINDSYDEVLECSIEQSADATIDAVNNTKIVENKPHKLRRLFTFRGSKLSESFRSNSSGSAAKKETPINLVNALSPQTEILKKPLKWKIWRGMKQTGKIAISVDDRSNK